MGLFKNRRRPILGNILPRNRRQPNQAPQPNRAPQEVPQGESSGAPLFGGDGVLFDEKPEAARDRIIRMDVLEGETAPDREPGWAPDREPGWASLAEVAREKQEKASFKRKEGHYPMGFMPPHNTPDMPDMPGPVRQYNPMTDPPLPGEPGGPGERRVGVNDIPMTQRPRTSDGGPVTPEMGLLPGDLDSILAKEQEVRERGGRGGKLVEGVAGLADSGIAGAIKNFGSGLLSQAIQESPDASAGLKRKNFPDHPHHEEYRRVQEEYLRNKYGDDYVNKLNAAKEQGRKGPQGTVDPSGSLQPIAEPQGNIWDDERKLWDVNQDGRIDESEKLRFLEKNRTRAPTPRDDATSSVVQSVDAQNQRLSPIIGAADDRKKSALDDVKLSVDAQIEKERGGGSILGTNTVALSPEELASKEGLTTRRNREGMRTHGDSLFDRYKDPYVWDDSPEEVREEFADFRSKAYYKDKYDVDGDGEVDEYEDARAFEMNEDRLRKTAAGKVQFRERKEREEAEAATLAETVAEQEIDQLLAEEEAAVQREQDFQTAPEGYAFPETRSDGGGEHHTNAMGARSRSEHTFGRGSDQQWVDTERGTLPNHYALQKHYGLSARQSLNVSNRFRDGTFSGADLEAAGVESHEVKPNGQPWTEADYVEWKSTHGHAAEDDTGKEKFGQMVNKAHDRLLKHTIRQEAGGGRRLQAPRQS